MSRPATAGPTTTPICMSSCHRAVALTKSSRATSVMKTADLAGWSMLLIPAATAEIDEQGPDRRMVEHRVDRETRAAHGERDVCVTSSSLRLSMASAIDPPNIDPARSGPSWVRLTRPTSSEECVSRKTSNATPTTVSWFPRVETR